MNIKDKIDQIKLSKIKVPVYDQNMYVLDDSGSFPEPLTPRNIDVGDVLDELLKDISNLTNTHTDLKARLYIDIVDKYDLW